MEKKQVICKRLDFKGINAFWKEVNELFADGWRYNESQSVRDAPRFSGLIRVTLCKETPKKASEELVEVSTQVVNTKPSQEDTLDKLTKKKELLKFAKDLDIEIPEYVKQPVQIKKIIKEQLK